MSKVDDMSKAHYEAPKVVEIGKIGSLVQGAQFGDMGDGGLTGSGKQVQTLQTFV